MAQSSNVDKFAQPGLKYTGKIQVGGGPVPLQRHHRPYTRDERDRPYGAEGVDLHAERPQHQKSPPPPPGRKSKK